MRPIYETTEDRRAAVRVMKYVSAALAMDELHEMEELHTADFLARKGDLEIYAEVKCRRNAAQAYPTYMLSKAKYDALLELGKPAMLVVKWSDGVGITPLPVSHTVGRGGRWDRGDSKDVEQVVYIPIDNFMIRQVQL